MVNGILDDSEFQRIKAAINSGHYVTYEGSWSSGFVIGAWIENETDAYLVMRSDSPNYKPFKSGYEQALANGYAFTIRGDCPDDWAS